jgi:hypothetical protein
MVRDYSRTLEVDNPSVQCGHCRFGARLAGVWSVEDGRLVFRADADPQPRRGPDLTSCCESDSVVEFESVMVGDRDLSGEEIAALRATAEYARLHEFDPPA